MKPVGRLRRALQWMSRVSQLPYYWRTATRIDRDGFDRRHGTDTSRLVQTRAPAGYLVNRYETADAAAIARAIESVGIDASRFTFVDLGCGKGKPVIIAAGCPFRRVIGVDISPPVVAIARKNIGLCGLAGRVELVVADAVGYDIPAGPVLIYLFNPFPERIVTLVMEKLVRRLAAFPDEPIVIVYMNPEHAHVIEQTGRFRRVSEVPGIGSPYERACGYVGQGDRGGAGPARDA